VAVQQAALVSDESALEACLRRCDIQIDDRFSFVKEVMQKLLSPEALVLALNAP